MTDPQIEAAARKLCELRGEDPDGKIPHGHPDGYLVLLHTQRWKLYAGEIIGRLMIDEAIDYGRKHRG